MAKYRYTLTADTDKLQVIELDNGKTMIMLEEELSNEEFEASSVNADWSAECMEGALWGDFEHRFDFITDYGEIVEFDEDTGERLDTVTPLFITS